MSFIVWAHHMFMTGMGTTLSTFFQATTMIISVPSVIILTAFILSLWGASIRFTVPMLFALSFLPMFAIGGLTGLPLGLTTSDIHLHDTYYVIGHFHYVVAPGTIMGLFAGIYYWYPKVTGRKMSTILGHIHFWPTLLFMNTVFMPMLFIGLAGVSRRLYDQTGYVAGVETMSFQRMSSFGAWGLGFFQLFFIINFFWSIRRGKKVSDNPWEATTLEWAAPSPPPHGNFATEPVVYRGPYEYSVPGHSTDYWPQHEPQEA
jgi:cytochrome c oxidase subunit 1